MRNQDFATIDTPTRMGVRLLVDDYGGEARGYGRGITIAVPVGVMRERLEAELAHIGMTKVDDHYFPLGSDCRRAGKHLWHESPRYPGQRGFWRFQTWEFSGRGSE